MRIRLLLGLVSTACIALPSPVDAFSPDWSPSGAKLAFERYESDTEIYVMNADGSGQVNLTNNSGACVSALASISRSGGARAPSRSSADELAPSA